MGLNPSQKVPGVIADVHILPVRILKPPSLRCPHPHLLLNLLSLYSLSNPYMLLTNLFLYSLSNPYLLLMDLSLYSLSNLVPR